MAQHRHAFLRLLLRRRFRKTIIASIVWNGDKRSFDMSKIPEYLARRGNTTVITRILATPSWVQFKDLRPFWDEAKRLTEKTGVVHEVDHFIPINHRYVCGLNVPANLVVTTRLANQSKGNKWNPDQAHFDFCEIQLPLLQPSSRLSF